MLSTCECCSDVHLNTTVRVKVKSAEFEYMNTDRCQGLCSHSIIPADPSNHSLSGSMFAVCTLYQDTQSTFCHSCQ